ncbi:uncharacterized protein LOC141824402 [Curcuma longa]|uniref:uncharacterized protein LOC141824402 n=1 Tax=Curcuma longa TaxID=136217 RepID=UPI003D9FA5A4
MASCQSCEKITSRDFGIDPSFCTPNFRESLVKHKCSTPAIIENIVKNVALEDLDILSINEKDEPTNGEVGRVLSGILHVGDSYKGVCDCDPATDKDSYKGVCGHVSKIDITFMDDNEWEDFDKHTSIHMSEHPQSPLSQDAIEPPSKIMDAESSEKPCTTKLISAMKGTREQLGMQPNKKLSVKWAPDVYDPPVTSESHTVKGHRRCYRIVKKEPRKQKHSKNKSYKGSSCDRKSLSRKSMGNIDCRMMMLAALRERSACQSNVEIPGYSNLTDTKCGNSVDGESAAAAAVQISVAKASKVP